MLSGSGSTRLGIGVRSEAAACLRNFATALNSIEITVKWPFLWVAGQRSRLWFVYAQLRIGPGAASSHFSNASPESSSRELAQDTDVVPKASHLSDSSVDGEELNVKVAATNQ
jgi:hypothetical protein